MYYASKRIDFSQERLRANSSSKADSNRKGISLTHRSKDNSQEHTRISVSGHEESQSQLSMLRSGSAGSILNKENKKNKVMTNGDKVRYKIKMITSASQPKEKAGVLLRPLDNRTKPSTPDLQHLDSTLVNLGNKEKSYSKLKIPTPVISNLTPGKNFSVLQSSRSSAINPKKTLQEFNHVLEQLKKRREDTLNYENSTRRVDTSINAKDTDRYKHYNKENEIIRSLSREKSRPRLLLEKPKEKPKYKEKPKGKENSYYDDLECGSVIIKDVEQKYFFETMDMKQLEHKTPSTKILQPQKLLVNRPSKPSPQPRPSTSKDRSKERSPKPKFLPKPELNKDNSKSDLRKKTPTRDFKEILRQKNGTINMKKQSTTPQRQNVTPQKQTAILSKVQETKVQFFNPKPAYVVPTDSRNQSKPTSRPISAKRAVKVESSFNRCETEVSITSKSIKLSEMFTGSIEGYGRKMRMDDSDQKLLNISVLEIEPEVREWDADRMYGRAIRTEADECYEYHIKPRQQIRKKL